MIKMHIKTVSIVGLGALGILFSNQLSKKMDFEDLRIIADENRIKKYKRELIYCNNEICNFQYVTPEIKSTPADLVIFAVKFNAIDDAIKAASNQIGKNTIILSALNGISSEEIIGAAFGMDKVLYCVAQGMDAVKSDNYLTYSNKGILCFGEKEPSIISEKVQRVSSFFDNVDFPYEAVTNMYQRQWGKLMLNVGVNQTVAVYEGNYGTIQKEGPARNTMINAMKEVMYLSPFEGVTLTDTDLKYWLNILDTLSPDGKPSMRQDLENHRFSEVELFSGTIIRLGKKHKIQTPVNQMLYNQIKDIEKNF
jgi:2-dehydropantoate 2-reductase